MENPVPLIAIIYFVAIILVLYHLKCPSEDSTSNRTGRSNK